MLKIVQAKSSGELLWSLLIKFINVCFSLITVNDDMRVISTNVQVFFFFQHNWKRRDFPKLWKSIVAGLISIV